MIFFYCSKKSIRQKLQSCLIGVVLALTMTSASLAMEEGRASFTAQAVCAFRAIGANDPDPKVRNPDHMAEKMLGQTYWRQSNLVYSLQQMKTGHRVSGLPTMHWVTARTLHVDHTLKQAVDDGARQVVILGAGYDSRAYRMRDTMPQVKFFEVDFPATQSDKLERLAQLLGSVPDWVGYAPIDFNKQALGEVLEIAGYQEKIKTFFVWEGVTYYLNAAAVENTLRFIAQNSAPGSRVFFDYMYQPVIEGDYRYPHSQRLADRVRSFGEPWTYGLKPYGVAPLVRQCGLSLLSDLGPKEFTQRYLLGSDGIKVGEPLQFLSLALAQVPDNR